MRRNPGILLTAFIAAVTWFSFGNAFPQPAAADDAQAVEKALVELHGAIDKLRRNPQAENRLPDVQVYAKAAEWIVRHDEFFKSDYAAHTQAALETGLARAAELAKGTAAWDQTPGRKILGYQSAVDESIQPYAISLPVQFGIEPERRWPLHLVLHGRGDTLNEVAFIRIHDGKPATEDGWIQLDVFGRTNNAYRYAGETDVFEALADVKRRYRIDDRRIVLHGFRWGAPEAGIWGCTTRHGGARSGPGPDSSISTSIRKSKRRFPSIRT